LSIKNGSTPCAAAITLVKRTLRPPWNTGYGYKAVQLDEVLRTWLEMISTFLHLYWHAKYKGWKECLEMAAVSNGRGYWLARRLREWSHALIKDTSKLPTHCYGLFNTSVLDNEDIAHEIILHLQSIGEYFSTQDIVKFASTPNMMLWLKLKQPISTQTAQHWLHRHNYCWGKTLAGQYTDGHEHSDVVNYRQKEFLPAVADILEQVRKWTMEGDKELRIVQTVGEDGNTIPAFGPLMRLVVLWCHDELIFYAHDCCKIRWVHGSEKVKPYAKGEGHSLMVADFVSADYGFLCSPDG
jgi:hypothetical protein